MRRASKGPSRSLFGTWFVMAVIVASLTASGRAWAQAEPAQAGFGDKGHFALSTERLFGYVHAKQQDVGATTTFNSISLLGSPISTFASVYTFPRVGFDGFIAPSISLGGSLTYFHLSFSTSSAAVSGFLVAPRLGFAARLAPTVWLWPRAGITYVNVTSDSGGGTSRSSNLFAATVEVPVVVALGPQALFLIGPTLDLGLSGSSSNGGITGSPSQDIKETDIGLQASLALTF